MSGDGSDEDSPLSTAIQVVEADVEIGTAGTDMA